MAKKKGTKRTKRTKRVAGTAAKKVQRASRTASRTASRAGKRAPSTESSMARVTSRTDQSRTEQGARIHNKHVSGSTAGDGSTSSDVPASIELAVVLLVLTVGQTEQITATVKNAAGVVLSGVQPDGWLTSNASVISVDGFGRITALQAGGPVYITATLGAVISNGTPITAVADLVAASVTVSPTTVVLASGTFPLTAIVKNAAGSALALSPTSWTSTDLSVCTVDSSGVVTFVGAGSSGVVAHYNALNSNVCAVTGSGSSGGTITSVATSIVISPSTLTLSSGTSQLIAVVKDQNGITMAGTQPDAWHSANTSVVTVSSTGLVTFVSARSPVNVTATLGSITSNACAVTTRVATTIVVTPGSVSLASGTTQLTAVVYDQTGTAMVGVTPDAWHSSSAGVVTVNGSGLVSFVAAGTSNVTASLGGITSNACAVTAQIATTIVVSPSTLSIAIGTAQLTAVVKDQTGAVMAGVQPSAWQSANTGVVTVNSSGLVTYVGGGGPVNVTATLSTANGTVTSNACAVTAQAPLTATTIVISPTTLSISSGTSQLTAVVKDQNGATMAGVQPDGWHSTNTGVVTVNSSGLVTFVADGTASVTATLSSPALTSNACAVTASVSTEPSALANVVFNGSDSDPAVADITAAQSYDWTARMSFTPSPGRLIDGNPVTSSILTENGQKILRSIYPFQDVNNYPAPGGGGWWLFGANPAFPIPGNKRIVLKFRMRIVTEDLAGWLAANDNGQCAIKGPELYHATAVGRLQTSWHNRSPWDGGGHPDHGTYVQVYDRNSMIGTTDAPGDGTNQPTDVGAFPDGSDQGTQPVGPYINDLINTGFFTHTLDYKQHTSTSVLDGWVRLWIAGVKIIDVCLANVGVIPPGGEKQWCGINEVKLIQEFDGVRALSWPGFRSTYGPLFYYDVLADSFSLTTD